MQFSIYFKVEQFHIFLLFNWWRLIWDLGSNNAILLEKIIHLMDPFHISRFLSSRSHHIVGLT